MEHQNNAQVAVWANTGLPRPRFYQGATLRDALALGVVYAPLYPCYGWGLRAIKVNLGEESFVPQRDNLLIVPEVSLERLVGFALHCATLTGGGGETWDSWAVTWLSGTHEYRGAYDAIVASRQRGAATVVAQHAAMAALHLLGCWGDRVHDRVQVRESVAMALRDFAATQQTHDLESWIGGMILPEYAVDGIFG